MRIGIIGAGNVGGALGAGWLRAGHEVMFGVRDQSDLKLQSLVKSGAKAGSIREAASFGDVVVLATPWGAVEDALKAAGDLSGKLVFDSTNPVDSDLSGLTLGFTTSAAEEVARRAPAARVTKIFNTTGAGNMANAQYPEGAATMFYCGDDAQAKDTARRLASDLGFDPVDAGPLSEARQLEPLAMLWMHLAVRGGLGVNIAFRLMRR